MSKCGTFEEHCCWLEGQECQYLKANVNGRHWACGLLLEHGEWSGVYKDERYISNVKPVLDRKGISNCGTWPDEGQVCNICGEIGGSA